MLLSDIEVVHSKMQIKAIWGIFTTTQIWPNYSLLAIMHVGRKIHNMPKKLAFHLIKRTDCDKQCNFDQTFQHTSEYNKDREIN